MIREFREGIRKKIRESENRGRMCGKYGNVIEKEVWEKDLGAVA